jgi:hypothetical protein
LTQVALERRFLLLGVVQLHARHQPAQLQHDRTQPAELTIGLLLDLGQHKLPLLGDDLALLFSRVP